MVSGRGRVAEKESELSAVVGRDDWDILVRPEPGT